jgi:hypothetical protein
MYKTIGTITISMDIYYSTFNISHLHKGTKYEILYLYLHKSIYFDIFTF